MYIVINSLKKSKKENLIIESGAIAQHVKYVEKK